MTEVEADDKQAESLDSLGRLLEAGEAALETYERFSQVLAEQLRHGAGSSADSFLTWPETRRRELLRALLRQEPNGDQPNALLRAIDTAARNGNEHVFHRIADDMSAILAELVGEDPPLVTAIVGMLLFRSFLPKGWSGQEIRSLHLDYFPRFTMKDLSLPYNTQFTGGRNQANVADLMTRWGHGIREVEAAKLSTVHRVFLDWLLGRPMGLAEEPERLGGAVRAMLGSEPTAEELAAGRAALVRYARVGSSDRMLEAAGGGAALGFADGAAELLAAMARLRHRVVGSTGQPVRGASRLTQSPMVQAWHAARHEVSRRTGLSGRWGRRPRVAVCVSGQLRGYQKAWASWQDRLLDGIAADVYVHTWAGAGHSSAQPTRRQLPFSGESFCSAYLQQCRALRYWEVVARYPSLFGLLDTQSQATESQLREFYGAKRVVVEDDQQPDFEGWSNSQKMHYKIQACSELALSNGESYDLVMRIRPDKGVKRLALSWRELMARCRREPVVFVDGGWGIHMGSPAIGDQFAIGGPEAMRAYSQTFGLHDRLQGQGLLRYPQKLRGHVNLAYVCWLSGLEVERVPIQWGPLLEPTSLTSESILDAVQRDSEGREDEWDRQLLSAIRQDLSASAGG